MNAEWEEKMGLLQSYVDYINESAKDVIGGLRGKRMLELGDQVVMVAAIVEKTGKEYFVRQGVDHTSVDLNGLNGSVVVDLSKEIKDPTWINGFDIVTNSGTSEHVEPYEGQYECFMNIHNCLKPGGIAVHLIPSFNEMKTRKCWEYHCKNYYSPDFFKTLAAGNNYKLISLKVMNGLLCACLQKQVDVPFMSDRKEFLKGIHCQEWKMSGFRYACYCFQDWLVEVLWRRPMNFTRPLRQSLGLYRDKKLASEVIC